ncbi:hypothetical protein B0J11DRAFT_501153 [Dendryphion nanum]|uniref:F-box domain-containing protein n=1 Tax=Dendryphion nanum TaxID=256645 RepID=A0A9P9EK61_9PLEO|nr:hypothetical protein B0J11DRAFT_501153 [Dendryphion nanum]
MTTIMAINFGPPIEDSASLFGDDIILDWESEYEDSEDGITDEDMLAKLSLVDDDSNGENEASERITTLHATTAVLKTIPAPEKPPHIALFIAEILDYILQYLSFHELLCYRGVCKFWYLRLHSVSPAAITTWHQAIPKPPFSQFIMKSGSKNIARFVSLFEQWKHGINDEKLCAKKLCGEVHGEHRHRVLNEKALNPYFTPLINKINTCIRVLGRVAHFIVVQESDVQGLLDLHCGSSPTASWRNMLLTNPPVQIFKAFSDIKGDRIVDEDGIRLGDVARYLSDMFRREKELFRLGYYSKSVLLVRTDRISEELDELEKAVSAS